MPKSRPTPSRPSPPPEAYLASRLSMRQVRLLAALDLQRNMRRAGEALNITQPAATRMLLALEQSLNLRLFTRTTRSIAPTPYGESLVRHCRTMLAMLGHAQEELLALDSGTQGKVVLGTLLVAASFLVPRAVTRFKSRHPTITVLLREGTTASLLPALRQGELDLVVGRVAADVSGEGLKFEAFYSEPMCIVSRVEHRLAKRRRLAIADLSREKWILPPPEAAYRSRINGAFRRANLEPPKWVVESTSILANTSMVRDTDVLATMPRDIAQQYVDLGVLRILPVRLPPPSGPVGVITALGRPLPPAASEVIHALREVVAEAGLRRSHLD